MAEDFEQTRLGWFNSGLQLAEQYGQGVRLSLAKQQQKSAEAEQAARERELNARISQIDLKSRQITDEIATSAREDAELLQIDTGIAKARTAWEAEKAEGTAGPDPDWSLIGMQELAPIAHRNSKARGIMEDMAKIEGAKALAEQRRDSLDPNSPAYRLRQENTFLRERGLEIAEKNLAERREGTELRRTGMEQGAVRLEGTLAGEGLVPTVPLMPGKSTGPRGAAVGEPLTKPAARPLTTSNATRMQQDVAATQLSLTKIDSTLAAIEAHPEAVGPAGVVGENLETIAGWLNPRREKSPIKDTRTKMRLAAHDIAAGLKLDAQISNYERAKLDEVADATGWMDSAPGTRDAYRAIQDALVAKALRQSNTLNQPISDELLARASADQIEQLVRNGLMTEAQARRWFELHRSQR